jgi:hypothetical protein
MNKQNRLSLGLLLAVVVLVITTTVAFAATKNYHSLTTVNYTNNIYDNGSCCWNPNYNDSTNPSLSMDQFGVNVWQTYVSCNTVIQNSTYVQYQFPGNSFLMHYNVTTSWDTMAQNKVTCPSGQTRRLHNYVQHWWQDSGYAGDGGTISQAVIK